MSDIFDDVMNRMFAEMREAVARRWPDIDAETLDHLQVARLFNEIAVEREWAITRIGERA
jgi:hypothetical protein